MKAETVTLWRPVGPKELALIQESGLRAFPPRLPEQPIFYPVTTEDYAIKIARDWNVPASGAGCYCEPDSRAHKWGLVLETIHFKLAQEQEE